MFKLFRKRNGLKLANSSLNILIFFRIAEIKLHRLSYGAIFLQISLIIHFYSIGLTRFFAYSISC